MRDEAAGEDMAGSDILNRSVDELKLSMASMAALRGCHIHTVAELTQRTEGELLRRGIIPHEIKEVLADAGLSLGMRFDYNTLVITAHDDAHHVFGNIRVSPPEQLGLFEEDPSILMQPPSPPKFADYLLYFFLSKHDRENIPGDLAEEYETIILPDFGLRAAKVWYWKQVICSIWPIVAPRLKRLAGIGGVAHAAYEIYRRLKG
jgi:hypothetical protein